MTSFICPFQYYRILLVINY